MNSFVVDLIISFISTFQKLVISRSIKQFGTNCRFLQMGRIVAWDELSLFGIWDELSLGTNCRLGRIVAFWNLGRIVARDELSLGTNCCLGRIVAWDELSLGTNCRLGRIVAQPFFKQQNSYVHLFAESWLCSQFVPELQLQIDVAQFGSLDIVTQCFSDCSHQKFFAPLEQF